MQRSATHRLAGLSVPPGSIAHLGLNSRSLSASLLNLKAEQPSPDIGEGSSDPRTSRRRELDEISIDSTSGDSFSDGPGSGDDDEGEDVVSTVPEPEVEGKHSPLIAQKPVIKEEESRSSTLEKAGQTLSSSQTSDGSSTGTIPTPRSPPPTYDFATGPPLAITPRVQPEAGPSRATPNLGESDRPQRSRSASPRRKSPTRRGQVVQREEDEAIHNLEDSLSSLVPALLERVPSSSSERSLFRSFDEQALKRGRLRPLRTRSAAGTPGDGQGEDDDGDDPNTFELSISDPPSPRSRSGSMSISMPGKVDKGKDRTRGGKGKRYIKIVDRSGGEWRDLVERPDDEHGEALDGDELSERIFKDQGAAHQTLRDETNAAGNQTPGTPTLVNKRLDLDRTRSSPRVSTSPDRPPIPRQTSSLNGSNSNAGEPFARDVQIIGWKIVGGETKVQKDRPGLKSSQPSTGDVRNYVEVERGKIGAFVGKRFSLPSLPVFGPR